MPAFAGLLVGVCLAQGAVPDEGSLLAPERRGGMVSLTAQLNGTLGFQDEYSRAPGAVGGFGAFADLSATWYAPFPLAVRVRAWPLLLASSVTPSAPGRGAAASVEVLFDTQFVGLGVGAGLGIVPNADVDAAGELELRFRTNAVLRVGALDGLHVMGRVHLRSVSPSGLWLAGLEGALQVPVTRGWWLTARGGGDVVGVALGDAGARVALRPHLFLAACAGFALHPGGIGPSLGVGVEYRVP